MRGAGGFGNLADARQNGFALPQLSGQKLGQMLGLRQPGSKCLVRVICGGFQAENGTLGNLGGGDQLRDRRTQGLFISTQTLQPAVQDPAIADGDQQKDSHQSLDQHSKRQGRHDVSISFCMARSNAARVIFGLRNPRVTRIAIESSTLPSVPSLSSTLPHLIVTGSSGSTSKISV